MKNINHTTIIDHRHKDYPGAKRKKKSPTPNEYAQAIFPGNCRIGMVFRLSRTSKITNSRIVFMHSLSPLPKNPFSVSVQKFIGSVGLLGSVGRPSIPSSSAPNMQCSFSPFAFGWQLSCARFL